MSKMERSKDSSGSGEVMSNAKKGNHAKQGTITGGMGQAAPNGLAAPFGSLISEDSKRHPENLPPKPPKLAV